MKKLYFIFIFILTVTFFYAHVPSDIILKFDNATQILSVNVIHQISNSKNTDPMKHFVNNINVSVNDQSVIIETLTFQQTDMGATATYLLKAKPNDKITVKASCSLSGPKSVDLIVK
jgi:desulfoferrodoxin (superoxide reductase-like protein)